MAANDSRCVACGRLNDSRRPEAPEQRAQRLAEFAYEVADVLSTWVGGQRGHRRSSFLDWLQAEGAGSRDLARECLDHAVRLGLVVLDFTNGGDEPRVRLRRAAEPVAPCLRPRRQSGETCIAS